MFWPYSSVHHSSNHSTFRLDIHNRNDNATCRAMKRTKFARYVLRDRLLEGLMSQ